METTGSVIIHQITSSGQPVEVIFDDSDAVVYLNNTKKIVASKIINITHVTSSHLRITDDSQFGGKIIINNINPHSLLTINSEQELTSSGFTTQSLVDVNNIISGNLIIPSASFSLTASYVHIDNVDGLDSGSLVPSASFAFTSSYVKWENIDDVEYHRYEMFIIDSSSLFDKYITLTDVPKPPYEDNVFLTIKGSGNHHYGDDFSIHNTFTKRVIWNGMGLDGDLEIGDKLTIHYNVKN